jgi:CubicO group peptidase (beta-lactamase class C family)
MGKPYETLLSEMIFQPLGMTGARVGNWPASIDEPQHPRGHYPVPGEAPLAQELEDEYVLPGWMNPSGGVHCTIQDFALYAKETLAGLKGTGILMKKPHYETIHRVHLNAGISDMYDSPGQEGEIPLGYGWIVIDDSTGTISTADGSAGTFYATIIVYPGLDLAFVGVTSCGDGKEALNKAIHEITGLEWE